MRSTHKCGACGAQLFTARFRDTGTMVHVEKAGIGAAGMPLEIVAELPGLTGSSLPHVVQTRARRTFYREHICPKARAHSAASFDRKGRA